VDLPSVNAFAVEYVEPYYATYFYWYNDFSKETVMARVELIAARLKVPRALIFDGNANIIFEQLWEICAMDYSNLDPTMNAHAAFRAWVHYAFKLPHNDNYKDSLERILSNEANFTEHRFNCQDQQ